MRTHKYSNNPKDLLEQGKRIVAEKWIMKIVNLSIAFQWLTLCLVVFHQKSCLPIVATAKGRSRHG